MNVRWRYKSEWDWTFGRAYLRCCKRIPVKASAQMDPLLVIFDLDETLVFADEQPLSTAADFEVASYSVYRRPHLAAFLKDAFTHFRVAIWTASTRAYAEPVLSHILPAGATPAFVWTAERCTARFDHDTRGRYTVKNLNKVRKRGFDLNRVVAVDDTAQKYERSYGNLVQVRPFYGDPSDDELLYLGRYLKTFADRPNVRAIEKRRWRDSVS